MGSFDQDTLGAVKRILFAIAENDVTSVSVLANKFDINRLTIANILILEKAELLVKIRHTVQMTIANKPNKYLFMSPAIRMSFSILPAMKTLSDSTGKIVIEAGLGSKDKNKS